MDFGDKSTYYAEDPQGNSTYFNTLHLPEDYEIRKEMISIRE